MIGSFEKSEAFSSVTRSTIKVRSSWGVDSAPLYSSVAVRMLSAMLMAVSPGVIPAEQGVKTVGAEFLLVGVFGFQNAV